MSDLSAEARDILESGRAAMTPVESIRHRVREAVAARLAAGPPIAAATGGGAVKLVLLSGLVIGAVVVGAVVVARQANGGSSARAPAAAPVSMEAPVGPVPPPAPTVQELPTESPAPAVRPRAPRKPAARPGLAAELALLEEARAALRTGTPGKAIDALDRHRRDIPSPQLEREALLLRAESLCRAGERDAGEQTLDEVVRRWPGAGGIEAVRARCGR